MDEPLKKKKKKKKKSVEPGGIDTEATAETCAPEAQAAEKEEKKELAPEVEACLSKDKRTRDDADQAEEQTQEQEGEQASETAIEEPARKKRKKKKKRDSDALHRKPRRRVKTFHHATLDAFHAIDLQRERTRLQAREGRGVRDQRFPFVGTATSFEALKHAILLFNDDTRVRDLTPFLEAKYIFATARNALEAFSDEKTNVGREEAIARMQFSQLPFAATREMVTLVARVNAILSKTATNTNGQCTSATHLMGNASDESAQGSIIVF